MFSLRYVKFEPNSYAILYKNGQVVKQGSGLNFWYFADTITALFIFFSNISIGAET